jgi:hypothetical protein
MSDRLTPNQQLNVNDQLVSPSGRFQLILQPDGNLVLYTTDAQHTALWSSNTWGKPVTHAIMQSDGNLVCYDAKGVAYWASNTWGNPGACAVLQDDGTLVVFNPGVAVLWTSGSGAQKDRLQPNQQLNVNEELLSPNGRFLLIMQSDGNLVLYTNDAQHRALWSSNTWNTPTKVTHAIMQSDGNLVCYDAGGKAYWSSNTWDHPGAYAVLLDGGGLVVFDAGGAVLWASASTIEDLPYQNWPGNTAFTAPMYIMPTSRAELISAIRQAEEAGHRVRAVGSSWSFSDAAIPSDASPRSEPGALIDTTRLNRTLAADLAGIVKSAGGVFPFTWAMVEAGMTVSALSSYLDSQPTRLALVSGGGSGQTVGGVISTGTHGGDTFESKPLVDCVLAIHLVGAGGVEYWIEPSSGITDPTKLQTVYPGLSANNIHYDDTLFRAALVAAGSMGVIYSVVLNTAPQYGQVQHRIASTWQQLMAKDGNLSAVMSGSLMSAGYGQPNLLDGSPMPPALGPFETPCFCQIVVNPYPLEPDDGTLSNTEKAVAGQNLCFVTNRVRIDIPTNPVNPPGGGWPDIESFGQAARNSLGSNFGDYDIRFLNFKNSLNPSDDLSVNAAKFVAFLAQNFGPRTISAVITNVLQQIVPVGQLGERTDVSFKLSDVASWGAAIRSLSVEAAFTISDAVAYVNDVLALVVSYAARQPTVYVAGYLSLRIVGQQTSSLLGMHRWTPTCFVEYAMLGGTSGVMEFVNDLQRLALSHNGALHWGQCNNVMQATDVQRIYGPQNVASFVRARAIVSQNGSMRTFDNAFTDRLALWFGAFQHVSQQADGSWKWSPFGGFLTSDAAVGTDSNAGLDVFARWIDGGLWHSWQTSTGGQGTWSGWASLGGGLTGVPAVAAGVGGKLEVFARGTDGALYRNSQSSPGPGANWTGWQSLGGTWTSEPTVATNANGALEVFIRGTDGALYHAWEPFLPIPPGWTAWQSLGGTWTSDPAVAINTNGALEVFVRGTDGALYHAWQTPNVGRGWSDWQSLGGTWTSDPAVAINTNGALEVFVRGTDGALYHAWQTPNVGRGWSDWQSLGGTWTSDPAVVANADGRLEVFVRGPDGALYHAWQKPSSQGGGWAAWQTLGGSLTGDPVVRLSKATGLLQVFVRGFPPVLTIGPGPIVGRAPSGAAVQSEVAAARPSMTT